MARTTALLGALIGALALLVMAAATPMHAQQLESGAWTGAMSPPGEGSVPVTYLVAEVDGALSISMSAMGESLPFSDVSLDGDELTFWWEPGPRVSCTLLRQDDGSFEGQCRDGSVGGEGTLVMRPPSGTSP